MKTFTQWKQWNLTNPANLDEIRQDMASDDFATDSVIGQLPDIDAPRLHQIASIGPLVVQGMKA
jgi:hypothetical protein